MNESSQADKKPKSWDEAIKELGAFIKATKDQETKQEDQDKE